MKRSETCSWSLDSERDANMLYATGLFVPDPFIYLRTTGRPLLVMSDLEIDRAARKPRTAASRRSANISKNFASGESNAPDSPTSSGSFCVKKESAASPCRTISAGPGDGSGKTRRFPSRRVRAIFFPEREIKSAAEVRKFPPRW